MTCRVCGSSAIAEVHHARERMFGTLEPFDYESCADCGCLQIAQIPADLGRHYPSGYYSFAPQRAGTAVRWLLDRRGRHFTGRPNLVGRAAGLLIGPPRYADWCEAVAATKATRILDVGAGGGVLVSELRAIGFTSAIGCDPLLDDDVRDEAGRVVVERSELADVQGEFDLVMLHHSLEHIADQQATLQGVHRVTRPGGIAIIRVPLVDSFAWRTYGVDWVQLDAPRHLYLHSQRSLSALAESVGFVVERVVRDSTSMQFTGSEMYRRGLSLHDRPPVSRPMLLLRRFRPDELKYRRLARRLNREGAGDQAAFYLRRPLDTWRGPGGAVAH